MKTRSFNILEGMLTGAFLVSLSIMPAFSQQKPLGQFEGQADVGQVKNSGSATYDEEKQEYTIAGSGTNMWFDHDEFHLVWKRVKGNFILQARAQFVGPGLAGGVVKGPEARANAMPPARGAVHSAEIEYALGNLATNKVYAWTPDDYKVSKVMQEYFANFVKTGDPNGPGLPKWPAVSSSSEDGQMMRLDVESRAEPDKHRARYLFLDQVTVKP